MIKTKQITSGAMVCAIYGALLLLNQQMALVIEASASWVFVFPVLIYTAMYGINMGLLVTISMGILTIFFGGFTTWFYSWTSLIIGFIYGAGIYKKFNNMTNFIVCFILSAIANILIILFWSAMFGMDFKADFEIVSEYVPFISLKVFTYLMIGGLSLLQALCIHLVSMMICMRMHIDHKPLQPISKTNNPRWFGIISVFIWVLFLVCQFILKLDQGIMDIIQIIFFIDYCLLLYFGVVYFMNLCIKFQKRKWSFMAIFGAFIPIVQFLWIFMGELDCLLQLRRKE